MRYILIISYILCPETYDTFQLATSHFNEASIEREIAEEKYKKMRAYFFYYAPPLVDDAEAYWKARDWYIKSQINFAKAKEEKKMALIELKKAEEELYTCLPL